MPITRIESLVFGVDDVARCAKFYADAGLRPETVTPQGATLSTPEGQTVVLRPLADPGLPPPIEPGPTLRELVWGVDTQEDLKRLADDLARDRTVRVDETGVVHTTDPNGLGIGLAVTQPRPLPPQPVQTYNMLRQVTRWNQPVQALRELRPMRIAHLALNIHDAGHEEAIAFYLERLRFKATDRILDTGTFMQCEGDVEHHNFFLCHRPNVAGINHFAVEMRNFDEVVQIGNHMATQDWNESRVLGRHLLGSNVYRFFASPAGGRLEFICDMDRMDKGFATRVWEKNPGHHIWSLKTSRVPAE